MVLSYEKSQGASLASATPRPRKGTEGGVLSGYWQSVREGYRASRRAGLLSRLEIPILGPSGSYPATPDLARNYGRSLQGFLGSTISLTYHIVP